MWKKWSYNDISKNRNDWTRRNLKEIYSINLETDSLRTINRQKSWLLWDK
jgi:hypothetical protein